MNDALKGIADRLLLTYAEHLGAGTVPTAAQLKEAAAPIAAEPVPVPAPAGKASLLSVFAIWIEERGLTQSPNTLRTYRTTLRHLRDLQAREEYAVDFATMSNGFADRFARYLLTHRGVGDSAVHKNMFRLQHFLKWAVEQGHPVTADLKKFRWQFRQPDILTLTRRELTALENLALATRPALDNARALFLLGVYTGLRFSDVAALRPEHIQPDRLRLTTQKNAGYAHHPDTARSPPTSGSGCCRLPTAVTEPSAKSALERTSSAGWYRHAYRAHPLRRGQAAHPNRPQVRICNEPHRPAHVCHPGPGSWAAAGANYENYCPQSKA